ncbi:MAG: D-glucosaminate-6-phosphate ammonia lyase [Chloroflexota bacterium]
MGDVYADLGLTTIINAAGTLTVFGGSVMLPEVAAAMAAASRSFVDMEELHLAAGRRVATLLGVDAAHVCAGAAAGIALMTAACMTGTDRAKIAQLPDRQGLAYRVVVQRAHRNPFDQAARLVGAELVEIDADIDALAGALRAAEGVAAVLYTCAWFCTGAALPLSRVVEIAHAAGLPVIVDAAAEIPPLDTPARLLRDGADLVAVSGGKALRGPQASGMVLGRPDLVEACRLNDSPSMAVGRTMKAGKEEIVGLVRAVESYVAADHGAEAAAWERRIAFVLGALAGVRGVHAWRQMPFGDGQQIPHVAVTWERETISLAPEEVARRLLRGRPRVAVQLISPQRYGFGGAQDTELRIHPHTMAEGDEIVVAARLLKELQRG